MPKQLFNKLVAFTDIHFGLKGDSIQHNEDCQNFITWVLEEAKKFDADTCIFLGDWHHNRARVNVSTMNYSLHNIERLANAFDNFYFITGNHDLYYRDKRDLNSIEFGRLIDNVTIVSQPLLEDNVAIIPWLNGEEWKTIRKTKCKYMFGHFELPGFFMNQMVKMPDTGTLHENDFTHPEKVFSGHFHKRQNNDKIHYIGNAFPHDFADAGDDERGMMFLEWDEEPTFKAWPDAPRYRRMMLSQLVENPGKWLDNKTYAKVEVDITPTYEELIYIKEELIAEFEPRDVSLLPNSDDNVSEDYGDEISYESVDSVVLSHLETIDSVNIDSTLLTEIYRTLE